MEGEKAAGRPGFRPVHPGRIIKRNIDALGLTIEAFADHIGTSRQTVHAHFRRAKRGEGGDGRASSAGVQHDAVKMRRLDNKALVERLSPPRVCRPGTTGSSACFLTFTRAPANRQPRSLSREALQSETTACPWLFPLCSALQ